MASIEGVIHVLQPHGQLRTQPPKCKAAVTPRAGDPSTMKVSSSSTPGWLGLGTTKSSILSRKRPSRRSSFSCGSAESRRTIGAASTMSQARARSRSASKGATPTCESQHDIENSLKAKAASGCPMSHWYPASSIRTFPYSSKKPGGHSVTWPFPKIFSCQTPGSASSATR